MVHSAGVQVTPRLSLLLIVCMFALLGQTRRPESSVSTPPNKNKNEKEMTKKYNAMRVLRGGKAGREERKIKARREEERDVNLGQVDHKQRSKYCQSNNNVSATS